jgi:hypothetical protein
LNSGIGYFTCEIPAVENEWNLVIFKLLLTRRAIPPALGINNFVHSNMTSSHGHLIWGRSLILKT